MVSRCMDTIVFFLCVLACRGIVPPKRNDDGRLCVRFF